MKYSRFGFKEFSLRWLFAFVLVTLSYNPSGYSASHWLLQIFPKITPLFSICILVLIVGWAIFLRATFRSLEVFGLLLLSLLVAAFIWLFWDLGWLSLNNVNVLGWVANISLSIVLAVGISWSHIRRRLTGQMDVDDIET